MLFRGMTTPPMNTIAARLLRDLQGGEARALNDLRDELADELGLSADERTALVKPGSREPKFGNRVGHARTLLVRLGLAEQPSRGAVQITPAGRAVLEGDRTPRSGIKDARSGPIYRALDAQPSGTRSAVQARLLQRREEEDAGDADADEPETAMPSLHVEAADAPLPLIPEPAAPLVPGPRALGRSIVLAAGDPVPDEWSGAPEVAVTHTDLVKRTATVDRLHRDWARRQPLVIRLLVDTDALRRPVTWTAPLWTLGRRFDPWTDRLLFLVWNNSYDGRGGRSPRWYWTTKAAQAGAQPTPDGPADVRLRGGETAWVDGGPRCPFPEGTFGDQRVLHHLSVEDRSLRASPPLTEPHAELAADQVQAVRHASGAARIIAPAGSGKTRVLTERLRHLLVDRKQPREQVVAVAYNRRAQEEMARRTQDFAPRVHTLNSLGWQILRDALPGVQLVDSGPRVRELFARHTPPLDRRANTDPLAPYVEALNITRQGLLDPAGVEAGYSDITGFADAFRRYRAELRERDLADYDEQLYRTCELLLADAGLRRKWQRQCRHLLVDEFQDLTPLHLLMIRTLGSPALDVFGTGDDDQVIYGYAGADPRFLIDFADLFPGAAAHALEVNYRCTPAVVTAAATLLTHNQIRVRKRIHAARKGDSPSAFTVLEHSPEGTAGAVVAVVRDWLDGGSAPRDVAVLCRVNAGLLTPQVALQAAGIPVVKAVTTDVLQRTGVRSALAYLRLGLHPNAMDSGDLDEASRRPSRGFTRDLLDELRGRPSWTMAELRAVAKRRTGRFSGRIYDFMDAVRDIGRAAAGGTTADVLGAIRTVGLDQAMRQLDTKSFGDSHIDDLDALANLAVLHPDAATFEEWLHDVLSRPSEQAGVTLATVHKVKGEEWDRVLAVDVRDGILPHRRAVDLEEERRILHVAITRGREEVVVLTDRERPSRFIDELRTPWTQPRVKPRRRPTPQQEPQRTVKAAEGMTLEANGGYRGMIVSVDGGGVSIATSNGARLKVRYGERVKVDGEAVVLRGG